VRFSQAIPYSCQESIETIFSSIVVSTVGSGGI